MEEKTKIKESIDNLDVSTAIQNKLWRFVYTVKEEKSNPIQRNLLLLGCSDDTCRKIGYAIACELLLPHGTLFVPESVKNANSTVLLDALKDTSSDEPVIFPSIEQIGRESDETGISPMTLFGDALINEIYLPTRKGAQQEIEKRPVKLASNLVFVASTVSADSIPASVLKRFGFIIDFNRETREEQQREMYHQNCIDNNSNKSEHCNATKKNQELVEEGQEIITSLLRNYISLFINNIYTMSEAYRIIGCSTDLNFKIKPVADSICFWEGFFAKLSFSDGQISDSEVAFYNSVLDDTIERDKSFFKELYERTPDNKLMQLTQRVIDFDNYMFNTGNSFQPMYKTHFSLIDSIGKTYFLFFGTPKRASYYNNFMNRLCQMISQNDCQAGSDVAFHRIVFTDKGVQTFEYSTPNANIESQSSRQYSQKNKRDKSYKRITDIIDFFQHYDTGGRIINTEYAKELESKYPSDIELHKELERIWQLAKKNGLIFINKESVEVVEKVAGKTEETKQEGWPPSLAKIDRMTGREFELYIGSLLEKLNYNNIKITPSSRDYGADIIATKDYVKHAIQCKCYSNPVGVSAVQEVIAGKSLHDCHVACVLTNNYFTPAAIELAKKNQVILWDRNELKKFIDQTG